MQISNLRNRSTDVVKHQYSIKTELERNFKTHAFLCLACLSNFSRWRHRVASADPVTLCERLMAQWSIIMEARFISIWWLVTVKCLPKYDEN